MSTGKHSPQKPFSRILIAEIDGTARSLRHQQLQFHRLQAILTKNRDLFVQALKDDYGYTEVEALFEYSLSLTELRAHYDSLDFEKEVRSTKTIENCTEGLNRHASVGIVYIVPRSGLYSVLSPLCAAMVAGNCVIVEVSLVPDGSITVPKALLLTGDKDPADHKQDKLGFTEHPLRSFEW